MIVKLIRDKLEITSGRVRPANTRAGHHVALINKIHEEVQEIARDPRSVVEYADTLEALRALAALHGIDWTRVEIARLDKHERQGGFDRGMIWVEEDPRDEKRAW